MVHAERMQFSSVVEQFKFHWKFASEADLGFLERMVSYGVLPFIFIFPFLYYSLTFSVFSFTAIPGAGIIVNAVVTTVVALALWATRNLAADAVRAREELIKDITAP